MKKYWIWCISVGILCLAGWLSWRYFFVVPPPWARDPEIDPRTYQELGSFNQPQFRALLMTYFDDLKQYRRLHMAPISAGDSVDALTQKLSPLVEAAFNQYPECARTLQGVPPNVIKALERHLAILLLRCADMPPDKYLDSLSPNNHLYLSWPTEIGRLNSFVADYMPQAQIPKSSDDQVVMRQLFDDLCATYDKIPLGGGEGCAVAWSDDPSGVLGVIDNIPADSYLDWDDKFQKRCTQQQLLFFEGMMAAGSIYLTTPPPDPATTRTDAPDVLRVQVAFVIKTAGNDYFPIHFRLFYDAHDGCWQLVAVTRFVSPRWSPYRIF